MNSEIEYLYQTIIMEHVKNPQNFGLAHHKNSKIVHLNNPFCGDEVNLEILIENGIIKDFRHEGHGCSISMASASIASEILIDLEVDKALKMINDFYEIVQGKSVINEEDFGDALAMKGVSKFPIRIKCATLAWKACEKILLEK